MRCDHSEVEDEGASGDHVAHASLEADVLEGAFASYPELGERAARASQKDLIRDHFRKARRRIATLTMLEPAGLPGISAVQQDPSLIQQLASVDAAAWATPSIKKAVTSLDGDIMERRANRRVVFASLKPDEKSDPTHHDAFFRVVRVTGNPVPVFAGTVLQGLLALRQELLSAPSSLSPSELRDVERALRCMIVAKPSDKSAASLLTGQRTWKAAAFEEVASRWIRGHQIFAVLNQGLVAAFTDLELAIATADDAASSRAAGLIALMLRGSDVSMRLTGDFPIEYYDAFIKASMEPPYMPPGFSGLLSLDHTALVRRMREAKPILDQLKARDHEGHAAIGKALAGVYDSHKSVCAKFAGVERQSLLMATSCGRSAVDQLEAFKKSRLRTTGLSDGTGHA